MKLRLGAAVAALTVAGLTLPGSATATPPAAAKPAAKAAPTGSPVALRGPAKVVAYSEDGRVYGDLGINLAAATDQAFEVRSTRPDWNSPIRTVWQSPSGPVALPAQTRWDGLSRFVRITIRRADGSVARTRYVDTCLNSYNTQRTNPDAPLRSPYPDGCPANPFTIGSVQGIQAGWVSSIETWNTSFKLKPGKYTITADINAAYTRAIGIAPADATRTYRLVVRKVRGDGGEESGHRAGRAATARPSATPPSGTRSGAPTDAVPDLRSLPAFGMTLSPNSKRLRFSATVWNAGDGPMVVDGFRRGRSDVMDAYQYFIDSAGNQTGYRKVGTMIWHKAKSHNHWHFEDFARYTLLRADKTEAVRSRKESFCLANTDAVDYTVPGADWRPENTDLHTACGDRGTVSLREVLASGSGDTYSQFRAGQAFRIDNLPNGIYYISVEGNPNRNLVESDTTNNVALRKIKLSGKPKHRKLTVFPVGIIDDEGYGYDEE
ncbi:lysyl oxidase family protein [Pimelobacter simplex]|uniref:lysyl oxidase family protein n=1 Tax=Nocardioides simplex TaxID=2045 RepID=UPI003811B7B0